YAHVVASAVEFLSITAAVLVAWRRTRGRGGRNTEAVVYRVLAAVLAVRYLLLAIAYFTDRWAALVEHIFFVAFTVSAVSEVVVADRGEIWLRSDRTQRHVEPARSPWPAAVA